MLIAALFIIDQIWNQPKCPSVDEQIQKLWYYGTFTKGTLLRHKKTEIFCDTMEGPGEYYAYQNKPVKERQVPYDFPYVWNLMSEIN